MVTKGRTHAKIHSTAFDHLDDIVLGNIEQLNLDARMHLAEELDHSGSTRAACMEEAAIETRPLSSVLSCAEPSSMAARSASVLRASGSICMPPSVRRSMRV